MFELKMQLKLTPIYAALLSLSSTIALAEEAIQIPEKLLVPRVDVIGSQQQLLKTPSSAMIIEQDELEASMSLPPAKRCARCQVWWGAMKKALACAPISAFAG